MCLHSPVQRRTRAMCHRLVEVLATWAAPLMLQAAEIPVVFPCHSVIWPNTDLKSVNIVLKKKKKKGCPSVWDCGKCSV